MKKHIINNQKKIVAIASLCVLIALFAVNCSKIRDNFDFSSISNPRVAIEDYSLAGSGCSWNFPAIKEDSLYVINDASKLQSFVTGGVPPAVDFNQYSLVLLRGTAYGGVADIAKSMLRFPNDNYLLNLSLTLGIDTTIVRDWHLAIKVPKLPQNPNITYNLYYPHLEVWECFEECSLAGYTDVTITLAMDTLQRYFYIGTIPQDLSFLNTPNHQYITFPFVYDGFASKYYLCDEAHIYFGINGCNNPSTLVYYRTMLSPDSMSLWTQTGPLWGRGYSFIRQKF